ncbi:MAG: DUF6600 domain-containing protein [Desulfobulbales bacterium]|nr:DUF6600 domain-containing protein [Desulfobulbales bacterium]
MKKQIIFLAVLFSVMCLVSSAFGALLVGRIAYVEGQVYRYMDDAQTWVETSVDSPAGTQDVLATEAKSRAEIYFPNNFLVRLNENVEIEILELTEDAGAFILLQGMARFYNKNTSGTLTVDTVIGTAEVGPGSTVDIQVNEKSVTVSAVHGKATFQSFADGSENLEIITANTSLKFKAAGALVAGYGPIDRKWDSWCDDRENEWARNRLVRSKYLPETMQDYAHVLEPSGKWHRIFYHGHYYWAWQPLYVAAAWSPYTTGYWYDWHGDPVWVDMNPWGWVTHHHGHWLHKHGAWMWTPYIHGFHTPGVTVIGLNITFGKSYRPYWHPGRVRWIARNGYIGWLPLAPREYYYGYRRWGPRSIVVKGGTGFSIHVNLGHHRYVDHAVVIPRRHFYRRGALRSNYSKFIIKNINKTIIVKDYKPVSVEKARRSRRHTVRAAQSGTLKNSGAGQHSRWEIKREKTKRALEQKRNRALTTRAYTDMEKERVVRQRVAQSQKQGAEKGVTRGNVIRQHEKEKRSAGSLQRQQAAGHENLRKRHEKRRIAAKERHREVSVNKAGSRNRDVITGQRSVQTGNRPGLQHKNYSNAAEKYSNGRGKHAGRQTGNAQNRTLRDRSGVNKVAGSRKYVGDERVTRAGREKHAARPRERNLHQGRGDRKGKLKGFESAAINGRYFRQQ